MSSRTIRIGGFLIAGIIACAVALLPAQASAGEILARVQSKGAVRCGVSEGIAGFSIQDGSGRWTGMDADFCRAVAAAGGPIVSRDRNGYDGSERMQPPHGREGKYK
jgi:general L-amino acid transport system substrate-binding protein